MSEEFFTVSSRQAVGGGFAAASAGGDCSPRAPTVASTLRPEPVIGATLNDYSDSGL